MVLGTAGWKRAAANAMWQHVSNVPCCGSLPKDRAGIWGGPSGLRAVPRLAWREGEAHCFAQLAMGRVVRQNKASGSYQPPAKGVMTGPQRLAARRKSLFINGTSPDKLCKAVASPSRSEPIHHPRKRSRPSLGFTNKNSLTIPSRCRLFNSCRGFEEGGREVA